MEKRQGLSAVAIVIVALGLLAASMSIFIVDEMHQAVVLQFGEVQRVETKPGVKFKIPVVQTVVKLEKRVLAWDGDPSDMTTGDKKKVFIDTSARWMIRNPQKFLESVKTESAAQSRLDDLIDGEVRKAVAKHRVIQLVKGSDRELTFIEEEDLEFEKELQADSDSTGFEMELDASDLLPTSAPRKEKQDGNEANDGAIVDPMDSEVEDAHVMNRRKAIMENVTKAVNEVTQKEFGIEVLDVRIKRLIYATNVQTRIFEKMISERKRISEKFRSTGRGLADKIRGEKEKRLKEILSEAQRRAEIIKGEGDAEATRIYAEAYNMDPEFYQLVKTLETYEATIDADTELILPVNSEVFRLLKETP